MDTVPSRFFQVPHAKLGWWAIGLAIASFLLSFAWMFLPGGAMLSFLCGLAGGIIALIAVIREHERSWMVWLSILPMFGVVVFILGEIFVPH